MRSNVLEICILALLIPFCTACLGGFGGGGSQCCPPRAVSPCPISQCNQPQPFNAPTFQQPPQYFAPQQPVQPYAPQIAPPGAYVVQPPSPFQQSVQPVQPVQSYVPPLNSGSTYLQAPQGKDTTFNEKYVSASSSPVVHQKPQPPGPAPHSTTSSSYGRKGSQTATTSTTSSAFKPEDGYNFALQDEDDITDRNQNQRQQQVESAHKKVESGEANDQ